MIHVPLQVSADVRLRVANTTQAYTDAPVFFNDCYEHAIINDGDEPAFLLAMTMYHPDLGLTFTFTEAYDDVLEAVEQDAVAKGLVEVDDSPCGGDDEDAPVNFHLGEQDDIDGDVDVDEDMYEDEEDGSYGEGEDDYDQMDGYADDEGEEGHDEL